MDIRITRPVIISAAAGLRHFAPGVVVSVSTEEGAQILRRQAGIEEQTAAVKGKKAGKLKAEGAPTPKPAAKTAPEAAHA